MKDISSELKAFFKAKGITQEKIANDMGCSQAYIGALLNGKTKFGKKNAVRFGELYQIQPIWLLTGEGEMLSNQAPNNFVNINNKGGAIGNHNNVQSNEELIAIIKKKDEQTDRLIEQNDRLIRIIEQMNLNNK